MYRETNQIERAIASFGAILEQQNFHNVVEIQDIKNTYVNLPAITYINLRLLGITLAFKKEHKIVPESFETDVILSYIKVIEPKIDKGDTKLILKYKADILRYSRLIDTFRSNLTFGK